MTKDGSLISIILLADPDDERVALAIMEADYFFSKQDFEGEIFVLNGGQIARKFQQLSGLLKIYKLSLRDTLKLARGDFVIIMPAADFLKSSDIGKLLSFSRRNYQLVLIRGNPNIKCFSKNALQKILSIIDKEEDFNSKAIAAVKHIGYKIKEVSLNDDNFLVDYLNILCKNIKNLWQKNTI